MGTHVSVFMQLCVRIPLHGKEEKIPLFGDTNLKMPQNKIFQISPAVHRPPQSIF